MAAPPKYSWWLRLLLSFGAGLASAVLVAIVFAVIDLYLTGHQLPALNSPLIDWPAWEYTSASLTSFSCSLPCWPPQSPGVALRTRDPSGDAADDATCPCRNP